MYDVCIHMIGKNLPSIFWYSFQYPQGELVVIFLYLVLTTVFTYRTENPKIRPSTAPRSNIKLKQLFTNRIYFPLVSNHHYALFITLLEPVSTLLPDPTITNFFASRTSMHQLTVNCFSQRYIHIAKKCIVRFAVNEWGKLYHFFKTMFNKIYEKCPRDPRLRSYECV